MAELTPKNPLQVTQEEVKRVALACADEHGWSVRLDDCQVEEIPTPTQAIDEIGLGSRLYKPPANRWIVTFDAKAPPNRNKAVLGVPVELAWGKLWAHDLIVEEYRINDYSPDKNETQELLQVSSLDGWPTS